jgi:4-amino-4-deoxy-L-arabinose transferase-like glycosyltransferase
LPKKFGRDSKKLEWHYTHISVTESTNQVAGKNWDKPAARIGWTILIVATLYVCYFSHLGAIGFVGPDEPRYAWVARDMAETHDWITPHLYGKPWFEKPPLFYWCAALCFKLFGVSEAAARLPSAISALLATLAMAWLALRLYGAETARWLLLLLPTTVGMIGFSHAAATDMPFSGMLTIAMVAAAAVVGLTRNENTPIIPRTPWLALILFGFFLGLAVLAKGPAAIILCGGAVFFWALFTKRWRDAFRLLHPAAIAAFCFTTLPWYILCARRNPDFLRVFFIEHNFKRYLTPEFQHIQPFWFYGGILLIAFLPWTAILLWTSVAGVIRLLKVHECSSGMIFLLCWVSFCVAFFSLSQSKLPGYILPAVPALGLILARACNFLAPANAKSFGVILCVFSLLVFVLALTDRFRLQASRGGDSLGFAIILILLAVAFPGVILSIGFLFSGRGLVRNAAILLSLLPVLLPLSGADRLASDLRIARNSPRELAAQLIAQHVPIDRLTTYNLAPSWRYGLNFYLGRELPAWSQDPAMDTFVLSGIHLCFTSQTRGFVCSDVTLESFVDGLNVSHITPKTSPDNLPRGGQAQ